MALNDSTLEEQVWPLSAGRAAIDIEQYGDIYVLRCHGRLVAGFDEQYLQARLDDIKQMNCTLVLVDFRDVPSIGSAGIAFIVGVYTAVVKTSGGRFVLAGATPMVRRALEITRLSGMIPMATDFGSGLAALRA
jgi:anti-anti-sigma factor